MYGGVQVSESFFSISENRTNVRRNLYGDLGVLWGRSPPRPLPKAIVPLESHYDGTRTRSATKVLLDFFQKIAGVEGAEPLIALRRARNPFFVQQIRMGGMGGNPIKGFPPIQESTNGIEIEPIRNGHCRQYPQKKNGCDNYLPHPCAFSAPPCRRPTHKTRTKQVGIRLRLSRSLRPPAPKLNRSGGLQFTHRAKIP